MATPVDERPSDWLSLGPASRMIGVDPDTLRRWADTGRVMAFTTPGGHRRFSRRSLEHIVSQRPGSPPTLASLGATPQRVSAAYRRSYGRASAGAAGPQLRLAAREREAFRREGRRLVEALLRALDASDDADRASEESIARGIVEDLACRLAKGGTGLTESVVLFVAARHPFMSALGSVVRRRGLPAAQVSAHFEAASGLLDRMLLAFVAAHRGSTEKPGS
jgi:hypothetical protein